MKLVSLGLPSASQHLLRFSLDLPTSVSVQVQQTMSMLWNWVGVNMPL
nr:hypothetical protein [Dendronalium sp. ChiSLP03b]